jgi:hypothetical protein
MYGDGKMVDNPMMPESWRNRFMVMQILQKQSFEAALKQIEKMRKRIQENGSYRLLLWWGYGSNMARINEPLKGVISFHGNL